MNLVNYIADEATIKAIKNEYLDCSLSMKDFLNTKHPHLTREDKVNLICWSADSDKYEVLETGLVT